MPFWLTFNQPPLATDSLNNQHIIRAETQLKTDFLCCDSLATLTNGGIFFETYWESRFVTPFQTEDTENSDQDQLH